MSEPVLDDDSIGRADEQYGPAGGWPEVPAAPSVPSPQAQEHISRCLVAILRHGRGHIHVDGHGYALASELAEELAVPTGHVAFVARTSKNKGLPRFEELAWNNHCHRRLDHGPSR